MSLKSNYSASGALFWKFFKIFITMQQDGLMLRNDPGDAAIDRAVDRDFLMP